MAIINRQLMHKVLRLTIHLFIIKAGIAYCFLIYFLSWFAGSSYHFFLWRVVIIIETLRFKDILIVFLKQLPWWRWPLLSTTDIFLRFLVRDTC